MKTDISIGVLSAGFVQAVRYVPGVIWPSLHGPTAFLNEGLGAAALGTLAASTLAAGLIVARHSLVTK